MGQNIRVIDGRKRDGKKERREHEKEGKYIAATMIGSNVSRERKTGQKGTREKAAG